MTQRIRAVLLATAATLVLLPASAFAQVGAIAGAVRDPEGNALPGVTVEIMSPALIEKTRTTATNQDGRYQLVGLPAGVYKVSFKLEQFATAERTNVQVNSELITIVNAVLKAAPAPVAVAPGSSWFWVLDSRFVFSSGCLVRSSQFGVRCSGFGVREPGTGNLEPGTWN